jgi:hypothetical protein
VQEDGTVSTQGHAEAAHKPHAHTARQKEVRRHRSAVCELDSLHVISQLSLSCSFVHQNIGVKVTQRLQQAKAALRHWLVEPDEVVRCAVLHCLRH